MKRPPFTASVLAVAGIAVLCGLGTWQVYRLSAKEELLARIEIWRAETPPPALAPADFKPENLYRHGLLQGEWLAGHTIRLVPRSHDGKPGAHLYTPLKLTSDSYVMVNRGWVPQDYNAPPLPQGRITIEGDIAPYPAPNAFTPENKAGARDWYRLSPSSMDNALGGGLKAQAFILRASDSAAGRSSLPDTEATAPQINNNHASYAAFWFTMAGVLALIFFLRFMRTGDKA